MIYCKNIIEERKVHASFDVPLWSAQYQAYPALSHISETKLKGRLSEIEKNIQFLSGSAFWNDAWGAEYGWQSPWWWFRARQFTLCELERRGMVALAATDIDAPNKLHRDYLRRRKPLAVRISKIPWLLDLLDGKIRFGAASGYADPTLQAFQRDDEISRDIFLPGSLATIMIENGVRQVASRRNSAFRFSHPFG